MPGVFYNPQAKQVLQYNTLGIYSFITGGIIIYLV